MSASPRTTQRRSDIQGLRAFAVLAVITFHARLGVPGGFVGVDVFFVISGFVITGMLQREFDAQGRIGLRRFYVRRMTRLVPALAVLVGTTVFAAMWLLSPLGLQQLTAKTGAAAMVFVANIQIAASSGGYFAGPAERNPLLNLWSLSVEEQFYFAFPVLLVLAWSIGRRLSSRWVAPSAVLLLSLGSFSLMMATVGATSFLTFVATGFYSPLSRAWEFGVGALLALLVRRAPGARGAQTAGSWAGLIGIGLLAASLWIIGPSTPFPSIATLLPVSGAALVILAGSLGSTASVRAWSLRPLVFLGDRSYSLYLWHWPFIVFAAALWPLTWWAVPLAAGLSFAPALLSYHFVEERFRHLRWRGIRSGARFALLAFGLPLVLCFVTFATAQAFWKPRYESGSMATYAESIGSDDLALFLGDSSYACSDPQLLAVGFVEDGINHCVQSKPSSDVTVAVVGDSHAEHLYPGLAAALPNENVASYFFPETPDPSLQPFTRIFERVQASPTINTVVLNAWWLKRGVPLNALAPVLAELQRSGKQVIVTADTPAFPFDAESCKYRKAPIVGSTDCSAPIESVSEGEAYVVDRLGQLVDAVPGARLVDTWDRFCDSSTCSMAKDGRLLYRDSHHLNIAGSRLVADEIVRERARGLRPSP